MPSLHISFQSLTPRTHALEVARDDGSTESAELETRSLLLHDFVHLAVEQEARLRHGFWGLVADGASLADLRLDDTAHRDLITAETLVGPMQAVWHQRYNAEDYVNRLGTPHPFVGEPFVQRVLARIRALDGQWRSTPFGHAMQVVYRSPHEDALTPQHVSRRGRASKKL